MWDCCCNCKNYCPKEIKNFHNISSSSLYKDFQIKTMKINDKAWIVKWAIQFPFINTAYRATKNEMGSYNVKIKKIARNAYKILWHKPGDFESCKIGEVVVIQIGE